MDGRSIPNTTIVSLCVLLVSGIFLSCGGTGQKSGSVTDPNGGPDTPGDTSSTKGAIEGKVALEIFNNYSKPVPEELSASWEPGEQILVAKAGVTEEEVKKAAKELGLEVALRSGSSNIWLSRCRKTRETWKSRRRAVRPGRETDDLRRTMQTKTISQMKQLAANEKIFERVTPNYLLKAYQEPVNHIENKDQWALTQWEMEEIWTRFGHGSDVIRVAVIDTGIFRSHPNLESRIDWANGFDFVSDADRSGDDDGGFDPDPSETTSMGSGFHGTHVSGIIAGYSVGDEKIQGIAGGVKVIPLRALAGDGGTNFDIAQAVLYAAGLPNATTKVSNPRADIINMSLGGPGYSPVLGDAIRKATEAGVLVIAAAGNENTSAPSYPASLPEVIGVGALDPDGERAAYSNKGTNVDVMAPGGAEDRFAPWGNAGFAGGILSTWAARNRPRLEVMSGTSMASPHVAALAALMLSQNKTVTAPMVRKFIFDSTSPMTCETGFCGRGKISPPKALEAAKNGQSPDGKDPTEIFVVLTDREGKLVHWVATSKSANYQFEFKDVALGNYIVRAGTDQDGNGVLCDQAKDYCGYVGGESPDVIAIDKSAPRRKLDVPARINGAGGWTLKLLGGQRT